MSDLRDTPENMPEDVEQTSRKAIIVEWLSIGYLIPSVALTALVAGQSDAMRAAWVEDALTFLPPIAFLIAMRLIRHKRSRRYPYGYHRGVGIGQLVSAAALLAMGGLLIFDSVRGVLAGERTAIGIMVLFGHDIWAGWVMIAIVSIFGIPPVILARYKLRYAEALNNKALYADADMSKADWMTAVSTSVGVLGVGIGLWWADPLAAIFVGISIVGDGYRNMKSAITGLTDIQARTHDSKEVNPLIDRIETCATDTSWVAQAAVRARDLGQVLHIELFVVADDHNPTAADLEELRERVRELDWKAYDVSVVLVTELPRHLLA
ncbi:MAG: cation transporter [Corynebacterium sp.]|uniref:cation diffusion facilitator family transporter n=1 Tax=Corynebacterium sp. TaxID=1720 RepID=UPI0026DEA312|nr:cation transporter [Corynebacterium sp.]MDO5668457.1 cation transporter [Corynebacterium sp.]